MLCFDDGFRSIVTKDVYGKPTPYMFEGRTLLGVEKYDEMLTKMYGNYMTPPPKGTEFQHNFYYLDLDKPYREMKNDE